MMDSASEAFSSLGNRNFRLYFVGQAVSMIGTWAQRVAMGWLAYRLTDSVWILGILGFASGISMLGLAPFGGALCDLYDRRRLMLTTQTLMLLQALVLVALTWSDLIQTWHLITLAAFLGTISAIDTPIRHSLISKLVPDRTNLPNAIALNSLLMNSARVIGPAAAAILLTAFSETFCFALNAATFLVMLFALKKMHWEEAPPSTSQLRFAFFVEGLTYARDNRSIRNALFFISIVSLTISHYPTLMPAIANELYAGGPSELGILMSFGGIGAVMSALFLTKVKRQTQLPTIAITGASLAGVAMAILPSTGLLWFGAAMMFIVGSGMIAAVASTNTWLQHCVDESMRGRVMGLFSMAAFGMHPIGSLFSGAVGSVSGLPCALILDGIACVLAAAAYARRTS